MFRYAGCLQLLALTMFVSSIGAQERGEVETLSESTRHPSTDCYQFNIRLLSVPEALIAPLRSGKPNRIAPRDPFAQVRDAAPEEGIILLRSETIVRKPQEQELVLLNEAQMTRLMRDVQSESPEQGGGRVMLAPTVLVPEGETGTVTSGGEFFWHTSETEVSDEPVFEGTQISVRARGGDGRGIPVDVRVQLSQLMDLKEIPLAADGVLKWRPEEQVFVLEFSALMTTERPHVAVLPSGTTLPDRKSGSRISLVSRLVKGAEEPSRLSVWVISCLRHQQGAE